MSVRAKFAVNLVREDKQEDGTPLYRVNMHAAQDGNKENKAFFAGVPSATLSLYTISENTAKKLVEGKLYYVDFIPAD